MKNGKQKTTNYERFFTKASERTNYTGKNIPGEKEIPRFGWFSFGVSMNVTRIIKTTKVFGQASFIRKYTSHFK